jgi:hypothetical protein
LICGLARHLLELGGQNGQGKVLYLAGFDRVRTYAKLYFFAQRRSQTAVEQVTSQGHRPCESILRKS